MPLNQYKDWSIIVYVWDGVKKTNAEEERRIGDAFRGGLVTG